MSRIRVLEYVDNGATTCGHCGEYFSFKRPPVDVICRVEEESGTDAYSEDDPWHEECIAAANAELDDDE